VPGSGRGSAAFGVAIVASTTRIHHYGSSFHGTGSVWGLVVAVVVIVIIAAARFMRRRRY